MKIECDKCKGILITQPAFTDWTCKICGKKGTEANTSVPSVCLDCAKNSLLCQRCGKTLSKEEVKRLILDNLEKERIEGIDNIFLLHKSLKKYGLSFSDIRGKNG